jgi:hypothetical protein
MGQLDDRSAAGQLFQDRRVAHLAQPIAFSDPRSARAAAALALCGHGTGAPGYTRERQRAGDELPRRIMITRRRASVSTKMTW